jgi:hypothetical protein
MRLIPYARCCTVYAAIEQNIIFLQDSLKQIFMTPVTNANIVRNIKEEYTAL